jgi:hypothetical protein
MKILIAEDNAVALRVAKAANFIAWLQAQEI